jgi:hypothetical protein
MNEHTPPHSLVPSQVDITATKLGNTAELGRQLQAFSAAQGSGYKLDQDADGRLVVVAPDGQRLAFAGTEVLMQVLDGRLPAFAEELRSSQIDIARLLRGMDRQLEDPREW